jgi:hypothetical protein
MTIADLAAALAVHAVIVASLRYVVLQLRVHAHDPLTAETA